MIITFFNDFLKVIGKNIWMIVMWKDEMIQVFLILYVHMRDPFSVTSTDFFLYIVIVWRRQISLLPQKMYSGDQFYQTQW